MTTPTTPTPQAAPEPQEGPQRQIWPGHPYPLGATYNGSGTNFALYSSAATGVDLCLFDDEGHEERVALKEVDGDVWHAYLPGIFPGQKYGYRVAGPYDPASGHRCDPSKLLLDPYAKAISGEVTPSQTLYSYSFDNPEVRNEEDSAGHTMRSVVINPYFDWGHDRPPNHEYHETIIYEAHVKGLTYQLPGVPEELRGTYAGLAHSVTVEHLKALGITTIELLPIHASVSEPFLTKRGLSNYWGYSTLSYFAPEPSYATAAARAAGPQAVLDEVRGMVSMLHEAGLEVVLDVVYNHTCEGGVDGPSLSLRGLDNLDYYLHAPYLPAQYMDVTGTGNTVDFRATGAIRLVLDSLRYWVTEVGVDGFRFDLATTLGRHAAEFSPRHPLLTAIATDPVLSTVKLISEPWDVGPGGWRTGQFPEPFQDWNDHFRDTTRSFWLHDASEISKGRLGSDLRDLATRLSGSADLFSHGEFPGGRGPLGSVNFVAAHDGFTLRDLVVYDHKHNLANKEDNRDGNSNNRSWNHGFEGDVVEGINGGPIEVLRRRSMRNLLATVLLSAGTPMLVAGDEMGRTQQGNNNCYCQDSVLSWVDWNLEVWQRDLVATTRFLIHQRHSHPVVRPSRFATGQVLDGDTIADLAWYRADAAPMDGDSWHDPHTRVVQMLRSGHPWNDDDMLVVINGALDQVDVVLPEGRGTDWHLAWDSTWAVPQPHTAPFSQARRVSRSPQDIQADVIIETDDSGEVKEVRTMAAEPEGHATESLTDCHHDRPGDTTMLEALSLRIYFSGEPLETLKAGSQTEQTEAVGAN